MSNLTVPNPDQASQRAPGNNRFRLSLDVWAVALALALSFLVWSGAIKRIPW
jgi:hypothetical protein